MSEEKVEYSVSGRGGFRPGAGRKAERGKTVVMRVPEAYKAAIDGKFIDCVTKSLYIDSVTQSTWRKRVCLKRKLSTAVGEDFARGQDEKLSGEKPWL